MTKLEEGYSKGDTCNRDGCKGIIAEHESDGCCSCHINPPCSYCTTSREYCPECYWDGREEQIQSDNDRTEAYNKMKPLEAHYNLAMDQEESHRDRILKRMSGKLPIVAIDWTYESHTHFSMIKFGVFPTGTTREELVSKIKGTFGGRFEYFNPEKGTFRYIAYTD